MAAADSLVAQTEPERAPAIVRPRPPPLSRHSTIGVANSIWSSRDFMVGAGMVIIQQNTHNILVVFDTQKKCWFFPQGRKKIGETLEKAALRKAHEESGYHAEFMPLLNPTTQPAAHGTPSSVLDLNMEPTFMTLAAPQPSGDDEAREYIITWYAGQIPDDARAEDATGMLKKQNYETYFLPNKEAREKVNDMEKMVLRYVWGLYCDTDDYFFEQECQGR